MVTMVETRIDDIPREFKFNLEESTKKIRMLTKRTVEDVVEIGRELKWVKDHLEHGRWQNWVREELGWDPSTAWRFMDAARRYENLELTQYLDEQAFIQELWGNVPKTKPPKSQEDVLKWLDRELDRISQELRHVVSQLIFCHHLTPTNADKLRNLAQTLTDMADGCEIKASGDPNELLHQSQ